MSDVATLSAAVIVLFAATTLGKYLRIVPEEGGGAGRAAFLVVVSVLLIVTALLFGWVAFDVKKSFETFDGRLRSLTADTAQLDMLLRDYGGEAAPIRAKLRAYLATEIVATWPDEPRPPGVDPAFRDNTGRARTPPGKLLAEVDAAIGKLEPADPALRERAALLKSKMAETLNQRQLVLGARHDQVPWPLVVGAIAWLSMIFCALGLLAPRKVVVQTAIAICALTYASAIYFIIDFDTPFDGAIRVSSAPARDALRGLDSPAVPP